MASQSDNVSYESARLIYYEKGIGAKRVGYGKKFAVLVIDMQNAFIKAKFQLGVAAGLENSAMRVVAAIASLLSAARKASVPIVYTRSVLRSDETDLAPFHKKWPTTEIYEGAVGSEIIQDIKPLKEDKVIVKRRPSGFFATELDLHLRSMGIDTVIVTGATTSGCVRATVVDAASYNYFVIVPKECVLDRSAHPHEANLFDMSMKYADVVDLDEVDARIRQTIENKPAG